MNVADGTACGDVSLLHQSSVLLPNEFKPIPQSIDMKYESSY